MNDTYSIRAEKLHKRFGELPAVDGVSLQVKPGEIYGLVGPDGAGKTTTLRLLIGALKADEGEAVICGYSVNRQVEQARGTVGYLSQRFSLYDDLTVLENIRFFAEVRGLLQPANGSRAARRFWNLSVSVSTRTAAPVSSRAG